MPVVRVLWCIHCAFFVSRNGNDAEIFRGFEEKWSPFQSENAIALTRLL